MTTKQLLTFIGMLLFHSSGIYYGYFQEVAFVENLYTFWVSTICIVGSVIVIASIVVIALSYDLDSTILKDIHDGIISTPLGVKIISHSITVIIASMLIGIGWTWLATGWIILQGMLWLFQNVVRMKMDIAHES